MHKHVWVPKSVSYISSELSDLVHIKTVISTDANINFYKSLAMHSW